jgi:hypothetical protein
MDFAQRLEPAGRPFPACVAAAEAAGAALWTFAPFLRDGVFCMRQVCCKLRITGMGFLPSSFPLNPQKIRKALRSAQQQKT